MLAKKTDIPISKFRGCLVGLALGDAVGFPLEGMKSGFIKQMFGDIEGFVDCAKIPLERFSKFKPSGFYSDDTQQALVIADVLVSEGGFFKEALAEMYIRLLDKNSSLSASGVYRGCGANFLKAVRKMRENPENLLCCGEPSSGNGAAMRIAPVGLFYCEDAQSLMKAAIEASLLTHSEPVGISAACAVAYAVFLMLKMKPDEKFPLDDFCFALIDFTRKSEDCLEDNYWKFLDPDKKVVSLHAFSDALGILKPILREGNDDIARSTIIREANRHNPMFPITAANSCFAPASVIASLYYSIKYNNFSQGILTAVLDGKDTDTVGAMAGALLGARLGIENIPSDWIRALHGGEQVLVRADALFNKEIDYNNQVELESLEARLTSEMMREQQSFIKEHQREIERIKERKAAHEALKTKAKEDKQKIENLPFAPPPETYLTNKTTKADKVARGRKRIAWKETRKFKEKEKWSKKE